MTNLVPLKTKITKYLSKEEWGRGESKDNSGDSEEKQRIKETLKPETLGKIIGGKLKRYWNCGIQKKKN